LQDLASLFLDYPGDFFPELAGTKFRIEKFLDQAGLYPFLTYIFMAGLFARPKGADCMCDRFSNGNALNPLGAPLGRYFGAGYSPDLFGKRALLVLTPTS
jgi:hypothetical protein